MEQPRKRCIIVAGMHRSGTSALTRTINLLGADIASDLMPPVVDNNERGFWEPVNVVRIHDEILGALGTFWHDPFPLRDGWLNEAYVQDAKRRLAEEVKRDFERSSVFVVKDPRISRLLPLWLEMLNDLEIDPIIAITVRNPLEVASSLKKRDGFSIAKSLLLYVQGSLDAEFYSRGCERLFVSYERLLDDWRPVAKSISALAGLAAVEEETRRKIDEYLSVQLRHNRFSRIELTESHEVTAIVVDLFDCLERAAASSKDEDLVVSFDRLRMSFLESCRLFLPLIQSERSSAAHEASRLQSERTALESRFKSELGTVLQELELDRHRSAALEEAKSALRDAQLREQFLELEKKTALAQLGRAASHNDALSSANQGLSNANASLSGANEALSSANEALSNTNAILSGANEASSRAIEALSGRLIDLEETLRSKDEEAALVRADTARTESVLAQRNAEIARLNQALEERASKLSELETRVALSGVANGGIKGGIRWPLRKPSSLTQINRLRRLKVLSVFRWIADGTLVPELKMRLRFVWEQRLISSSGVFDRVWYLNRYPDVARTQQNPASHYLRHGARELRDPGPLFDTKWYLDRNPDVRRVNLNPLVHYLRHGGAEGRDPNQMFDSDWYLSQNADVQISKVNPLVHYARHGSREARDPSPRFRNAWYRTTYPDLPPSFDPLAHYLQYGRSEGRSAAPAGDVTEADQRLSRERLYGYRRPARESAPAPWQASPRQFWTSPSSGGTDGRLLNVVFISYGPFDCNSGGHIAGFANALVGRGHNVTVCADGDRRDASSFGNVLFHTVSRTEVFLHTDDLPSYLQLRGGIETLVHCWTPRETARRTTEEIVRRLDCRYLVHLEDNEQVITRSQLRLSESEAERLSPADWDLKVPMSLSHPVRAREFLSNSSGVSVIMDALQEFVPDHVPLVLLQPGVDFALFKPASESDRRRIRQSLGLQSHSIAIVYPGNMHAANAREMFSLYTAIQILNRRGRSCKLIRTGTDHVDGFDISFQQLKRDHVIELGQVDRSRVIELLQAADVFVQPGSAGPFNDFRLPAKVPEFMSMERPVILPATNVGLRLRNREDALLLDRGDGVEIADRVCEIIENEEIARKLGTNARRFALQNFDWKRAAEQLEKFYHSLLQH